VKNFNKIILSLGSNIGDKKSNLETAINQINQFSTIKKISSIYESDPILLKDQDNFFNLVLEIDYKKTVIELLETTKDVERRMGRKKTVKYGPRIIDIDIVFFNNQIVNSKDLVIPHYDWSNRVFVVKPLSELFKEFNMQDYKLDIQKINKVGRVNTK
jgi:2-amino-4-hydroxy-6-hydroxymethyldihydropteridine diphosphokinase